MCNECQPVYSDWCRKTGDDVFYVNCSNKKDDVNNDEMNKEGVCIMID